ncbi:MAG: hypothetical protein WHS90_15085 [Caldilinea sp.]|jgi:hypothetical protein|uniref:hypothetical protein n=1 Tax=Caldilinea sp. TaxID=2293560 RepID=UPI0030AE3A60
MAKEQNDRFAQESAKTLATLQRIYAQHPIRRDKFGRRPALPSEIAAHLKTLQLSGAAEPQNPRDGSGSSSD